MAVGGLRKLVRAREHIVAASGIVQAWLDGDAFGIETTMNHDTGRTEARVRLTETSPDGLALVVGDAVHNLRAALDHALFDTAHRHAGESLTGRDERTLSFPILGAAPPEGFEKKTAGQLPYVPADVRGVVEESQPYRQSSAAHPDGFRFHPLWQLHELDRIDKHRRLAVTAASLGHQAIGVPEGVDPDVKFHLDRGLVTHHQLLATYLGAEAGVEYMFDRSVVLIEDSIGLRQPSVDGLLDSLLRHVEWVLWRISDPRVGQPEPSPG
jgi:hypothetical protein